MILKGIYINLTQNDALPVGGEGGGGGGMWACLKHEMAKCELEKWLKLFRNNTYFSFTGFPPHYSLGGVVTRTLHYWAAIIWFDGSGEQTVVTQSLRDVCAQAHHIRPK